MVVEELTVDLLFGIHRFQLMLDTVSWVFHIWIELFDALGLLYLRQHILIRRKVDFKISNAFTIEGTKYSLMGFMLHLFKVYV